MPCSKTYKTAKYIVTHCFDFVQVVLYLNAEAAAAALC